MVTIITALISSLTSLALAWMQKRHDLKQIEAGKKEVKGGRLVDPEESTDTHK